jgi:hypothetical protein
MRKEALPKIEKDVLSEQSRQLIAQKILERLAKTELYRGENVSFQHIMEHQILQIRAFLMQEESQFLPYLAKW